MSDVAQWLEKLGLGQYTNLFAENDIDFEVLPHLTDDNLKELGLTLGHRVKLKTAIEAFSLEEASSQKAVPVASQSELQPAEAERRQLTVMFCDLVGSTALSTQLDTEDYRDLIRAYQDACAGVVARFDGFIAKFMGDGVLIYFGWPQAHEDDAARAINTGLGITEAVQALTDGLGSPLTV